MSEFSKYFNKNVFKLSLITVGALSSTLGLRTELTIILSDVFTATIISIIWAFVIITVCAYYKAKADIKLESFIVREMNKAALGLPVDQRTVAENLFEKKVTFSGTNQEKA